MQRLVAIRVRLSTLHSLLAKRAIVVMVVVLSALFYGRSGSAQPTERAANPIGDVSTTLAPRRDAHIIELRLFDPRSAPVLTVLDSRNLQIAQARARGERLAVSLPAGFAGHVRVIVLASAPGSAASADLWVDGKLHSSGLRYSQGERLSIAPRSAGTLIGIGGDQPGQRHTLLVLSRDGSHILDASSGQRTAVRLEPGARVIYGSEIVGPFHWLVNVPGLDGDGDLLDDSTEQALGTCPSKAGTAPGVNCHTIADPRDTDGDGLMDGWEVMGFHSPWYVVPGGEYQPLQDWGADPRHKDVFLEIDFRRLTKEDNDTAADQRMTPAAARGMASVYADDVTADPALRSLHAASAANPDGRPGIALHLDTGVPPETPADATIYGDWGGHNAVDAIPDPNNPGAYIPQSPGVWSSQMATVRHGIFHYILGYGSGGGACGKGIACGFNFNSVFVATHEFGHTFGLDHDGTFDVAEPNCKPNYPSLMSYSGFSQFSDGRDLGILNDHSLVETGALSPGSDLFPWLQSKFGYKVDQATGSVDWNRDNVFAPAGTTVRANANFIPGGDCESTRDNEKSTGMLSAHGPAIVNLGGHLWVFSVTTDNRLAYVFMPTAFNCANVDGCPDLSFYAPTVRDISVAGVDAARIVVNGRPMILIVGIRPDGTMFETWMEYTGGLYVWNGPNDIPASLAAGEPSLAVSRDGTRVALAYKGTDGVLHFRYRTPANFEPERTVRFNNQPVTLPAQVSPGLAYTFLRFPNDITVIPRERLIGAFASGAIDLYTPATGDNWTKLPVPYQRVATVAGRPSLAWVNPPSRLVAADRRGSASGRDRLSLPVEFPASGPTTYGRLYVVYTEQGPTYPTEPLPNPVRMMMSYVDASGTLRIDLDSFFDNVWSYAYGIDLLQPGEIALRAAETYSIRHVNTQVYVRPHADGIVDLPYRNFDDWKVLAWGSCDDISALQPIQPHILCAPKGW